MISKAGFPLTVHDIRREPVQELVQVGANAANNPKEVMQASDIVCLSLPHPTVDEEVILGENGLLASAREGNIIVEMSTLSPSQVKRFGEAAKEKEIELIDCAVMRGWYGRVVPYSHGTLAGRLNFLIVGGKKDVVERCRPVLEVVSEKIYHVGELGAGQSVKLVSTLCGHVNFVGAIEGMLLGAKVAKKIGLDMRTLFEIATEGGGGSWMLQNYFSEMLSGRVAGFNPKTMFKTASLIVELAEEYGVPTPFMTSTLHYWGYLAAKGFPKDFREVIQYLEKKHDVEMKI